MGCCNARELRFWLLLENTLLFAGALVLLGVGADALLEREPRLSALLGAPVDRGTALLLTAAASLVLLISLLGCCGALYRLPFAVGLFAIFNVLLLALCVAGLASALYISGPGEPAVRRTMLASMERYGHDADVTRDWDALQSDFHCCGVVDGRDWARNVSLNITVPESCCRPHDGNGSLSCVNDPTPANSYIANGCLSAALGLIKNYKTVFVVSDLAVVVFLGLSACAACCFVRKHRQETYERLTV